MPKQHFGFSDTEDNQKKSSIGQYDTDPGPYIGIVAFPADPTRMGKLGVNIPELSKTNNPTKDQIIWCDYLSPFYGSKPRDAVSKTDPYNYKESQQSYGMWFVPPDIGTEVLVMFIKGNKNHAFWLGCVPQPLINQEIPTSGSSENTSVSADYVGEMSTQSTDDIFGTNLLPAGEKNSRLNPEPLTGREEKSFKRPVNDLLADQMLNQGTVGDPVRGPISSSVRRETPSRVFGMSTPGPIRTDSRQMNIGIEGDKIRPDRGLGHSFIMDDGDFLGKNKLTRLRTASGHQILMHDTEGSIYIANGSGNAWIEMTAEGRIDLYSGIGGINFRTEGDFNLHADGNFNVHAGNSLRMSATGEMLKSAAAIYSMGDMGVFTSAQSGPIMDYAKFDFSSYTLKGSQMHGAEKGQIHLAGRQVHLNSVRASASWGPDFLTPERAGMKEYDANDVELADKGLKPLEPFTRKTKTTVHRFIHHEPMPRFKAFQAGSVLPIDHDDKKMWSRLSSTPGTPEFIAQQNRISENKTIRDAQYQTDMLSYVKTKMGNSTDVAKARKLINDFGKKYDDTFQVVSQVGGAWDTANDSISNAIGKFPLSDQLDVSGNIKEYSSKLTSQVIENLTGKGKDIFANKVFVNNKGDVFSLGDTVSGITGNVDIASLSNDINVIKKLKGDLSVQSLTSAMNVSSVSQIYKNVVGGNVTGLTNIQSINQVKGVATRALAKIRGADLMNPNEMKNLTNFGKFSTGLKKFAANPGAFFKGFKFSDIRLKEEIQLVGKSPAGINIYSFKYKHTDGTYQGVMAQEVPWATKMTDTGFYMVDYNKVDVEFRRLN